MRNHQAIPQRVRTLDARLEEIIDSAIELIDTLPPRQAQQLIEHLIQARELLNDPVSSPVSEPMGGNVGATVGGPLGPTPGRAKLPQ